MSDAVFLDSNVVLYAFTADDARSRIARSVMSEDFAISVQVLNEFANVARRKLCREWPEVQLALSQIRTMANAVHPLDVETHEAGLRLAKRYQFGIYDALIVASALSANSKLLYSEDMHHGLVIEDRLTIRNPFA